MFVTTVHPPEGGGHNIIHLKKNQQFTMCLAEADIYPVTRSDMLGDLT